MIRESGQILVLAIVVVGFVLLNTLVIISGATLFSQNSNYSVQSTQALDLAEAGINKAIASLNKTGGSYNGETKTAFGAGEFSVTVTNKNPTTKIIKSKASVPSEENPKVTKTIQVETSRGIGAAFNYAIQIGEGGLFMGLNSKINGSVYSNGSIEMLLNNEISGDVYVAGGVMPDPDQTSDCTPPSCADFIFGKKVGGNDQLDIAQSFQPSVSERLNKVSLKLKKYGTPPNVTVFILGDSSGKPNKNDVKASAALSASLVSNNYGFVDISFANPPNLESGTVYWIVINTSSDSSNYWAWSIDTLKSYMRGEAKWSPDWDYRTPVWNNINGDLNFKTFTGGVPTYINGTIAGRIRGDAHANTLKNLNIDGDAYYQSSSNIHAKNFYPNSSDPGASVMPLSDGNIASWKQLAENSGTFTGDITNCPSSLPSGKYIGSLSPPNNCTILVDSPIWFTGDIILGSNTKIKLKPEYLIASGAFISDGRISLHWKDTISGSGTSGSYLILISEFNSITDPEKRDAIIFTYNENSGIVYANRGSINIAWGNHLTSVSGWKLSLGFQTTVDYDEGLAGTFFSSGPSGSYSLIKGTYQLK